MAVSPALEHLSTSLECNELGKVRKFNVAQHFLQTMCSASMHEFEHECGCTQHMCECYDPRNISSASANPFPNAEDKDLHHGTPVTVKRSEATTQGFPMRASSSRLHSFRPHFFLLRPSPWIRFFVVSHMETAPGTKEVPAMAGLGTIHPENSMPHPSGVFSAGKVSTSTGKKPMLESLELQNKCRFCPFAPCWRQSELGGSRPPATLEVVDSPPEGFSLER